ncbi:MAG: PIN domain-containing protein [Flavobacteriales bacterium]|nr:PIN domain-containing protein [Flavobacteriales bacterium]
MKYLLDTNICIYFFRGKFDLLEKMNAVGVDNCFISEITLAELVYGAENSKNPEKNNGLIDEFVESVSVIPVFDAIKEYGKQKARLKREGNLVGDFDLLIGSTAIANERVMVTDNTKDFERLEGIEMENWIRR